MPAAPPDECHGSIPPLVLRGLELFNAGEYFEAHEVLETAWRAEKKPIRELYRGILQVGVGYYHLLNGNYQGAIKVLDRARPWLEPFGSCCLGIDLDTLRADFSAVEAELRRFGPTGITRFNKRLLKPIRYQIESSPPENE